MSTTVVEKTPPQTSKRKGKLLQRLHKDGSGCAAKEKRPGGGGGGGCAYLRKVRDSEAPS